MINRLLVLGGGSDIAAAFVRRLADPEHETSTLTTVVLAGRPGGSRDRAAASLSVAIPSLQVQTADFDAVQSDEHRQIIADIDRADGPFDAVLVAYGQLGPNFTIDADPAEAAALANVNYGSVVSSCLASLQILRGEPNARLIVFSSVAAVRPRIGNIIYGAAKSGVDAFARELAAPAKKVGVEVVVVRPGFVHTQMTEGLDPAPFATTADEVAQDMYDGIAKGRSIVHSPAVLAPVGLVLKNLPGSIWRIISKR